MENLKIIQPKYLDGIVKKGAVLDDTINLIRKISARDKKQVSELAELLKANTIELTLFNIWLWIKNNIPYKEDIDGVEQVRTPARVIADAKNGIGSDCDCYTTFVSAILNNLNIPHYYKVVAWTDYNWAHIYPVAIDVMSGKEYAIDCIPEVTEFNKELIYQNHKIYNSKMDLQELNGALTAAEEKLEIEELQKAIFPTLNGFEIETEEEIDGYLSRPHIYKGIFGNTAFVDTREEADIVLNGVELVHKIFKAQLKDAVEALTNELKTPTLLSKMQNTKLELAIATDVFNAWETPERNNLLSDAIIESKTYSEFYKALLQGVQTSLNGANELSNVEFFIKEFLSEDELNGLFDWAKKGVQNISKGLKKAGEGIAKGVKKAVTAIAKYNPASMATKATLAVMLKGGAGVLFLSVYAPDKYKNLPKISKKANTANTIINQLCKLLVWERSAFDKLAKDGISTRYGSVDKAFEKLKSGQALAGIDDLEKEVLNGQIGAFAAIATIAIKLFEVIKGLFKKKDMENPTLAPGDFDQNNQEKTTTVEESGLNNNNNMEVQKSENGVTKTEETPQTPQTFGEKLKAFYSKHKVAIWIIAVIITIGIIAFIVWKRGKKKKASQLRKGRAVNGRTADGRVLNGKVITTRTSVRTTDNGSRLKKMHAIAHRLQKEHPKTSYSALLSQASKQLKK